MIINIVTDIDSITPDYWDSQVVTGKESACQSRRHRDPGSIPGLGRYLGVENGNPIPVFSPGKFPCTDEPGRLSPWGHKESNMTESTHIDILQIIRHKLYIYIGRA